MPFQKPCTTMRARSSKLRICMRVRGSINPSRAELAAGSGIRIDVVEQLLNNFFRSDAFGFGAVID